MFNVGFAELIVILLVTITLIVGAALVARWMDRH
jgi:hypothetical protein